MKCLYTTPIDDKGIKRLEELGYSLLVKKEKDVTQDDFDGVEVVVGFNPFENVDLSKTDVKFIQLQSQGFDHLESQKFDGLMIANHHGGYAVPIGEWIVLKVLESYKRTRLIYQYQKEHRWWKEFSIQGLTGKKILFVGTGTIAQEAAKRLIPFDVEIYGTNSSGQGNEYIKRIIPLDEVEDFLPDVDVLIPVLPWTKETEDLIDEKKLSLMKEGSVIINISRGQVMDEEALMKHLDKFLAVHLDVVKEEPLVEDSPLWDKENVYLSGHTSWVSEFVDQKRDDFIYDNLKRYIRGEDLENLIDVKRGY